ncbi:Mei1p [Balamuthia mandrillaris]
MYATQDLPLVEKLLDLALLLAPYLHSFHGFLRAANIQMRSGGWVENKNLLILLGRLLYDSQFAAAFVATQGAFVDVLLAGMEFPNEDVQTSISYIILRLASIESGRDMILRHSTIADKLTCSFAAAQGQHLQTNILAIFNSLVGEERFMRQVSPKELAKAFKPRILCSTDVVQSACIQLIGKFASHPTIAEVFLAEDFAAFLFESMMGASERLLWSVLRSLISLSNSVNFSQYAELGLESLQGIVIKIVAEQNEALTEVIFCLLINLLQAVNSNNQAIADMACQATLKVLTKEQVPNEQILCLSCEALQYAFSSNFQINRLDMRRHSMMSAIAVLESVHFQDKQRQKDYFAFLLAAMNNLIQSDEEHREDLAGAFIHIIIPFLRKLQQQDELLPVSTCSIFCEVGATFLASSHDNRFLDLLVLKNPFSLYLWLASAAFRGAVQPSVKEESSIHRFLHELLAKLLPTSYSKLSRIIMASVHELPAAAAEMLFWLKDKTSAILDVHLTIIATLYYALLHSDIIVEPGAEMLSAMEAFITHHSLALSQLPILTLQHLCFLHVICVQKLGGRTTNYAQEHHLIRAVLQNGSMFYQPPLALVRWMWCHEKLFEYNQRMVVEALTQGRTDEKALEHYTAFISKDVHAIKVLMSLFAAAEQHLLEPLLQLIVHCIELCESDIVTFHSFQLLNELQRKLMTSSDSFSLLSLELATFVATKCLEAVPLLTSTACTCYHIGRMLLQACNRTEKVSVIRYEALVLEILNFSTLLFHLCCVGSIREVLRSMLSNESEYFKVIRLILECSSPSVADKKRRHSSSEFHSHLSNAALSLYLRFLHCDEDKLMSYSRLSLDTLKGALRSRSPLSKVLASHCLIEHVHYSVTLSDAELSALTVMAQNNCMELEEMVRMASVHLLTALFERCTKQTHSLHQNCVSSAPWSRFIAESILATLLMSTEPNKSIDISHINFLSLMLRQKQPWMEEVLLPSGADKFLRALLLVFATTDHLAEPFLAFFEALIMADPPFMFPVGFQRSLEQALVKLQKELTTLMVPADNANKELRERQPSWIKIGMVIVAKYPGFEYGQGLHSLANTDRLRIAKKIQTLKEMLLSCKR